MTSSNKADVKFPEKVNISKSTMLTGTTEETQRAYTNWSHDYDVDSKTLGYTVPEDGAKLCMKYVKNTKDAAILDVCTGTGLLPYYLRNSCSYNGHIDVVDANIEMLAVAQQKNLALRTLFCHWLVEGGDLPIVPDSYDGVTCIGSFMPNHLAPTDIQALLKVTKPGGYLIFNTRERFQEIVSNYNSKVLEVANDLVAQGKMKLAENKEVIQMRNVDQLTASLYVYKKI